MARSQSAICGFELVDLRLARLRGALPFARLGVGAFLLFVRGRARCRLRPLPSALSLLTARAAPPARSVARSRRLCSRVSGPGAVAVARPVGRASRLSCPSVPACASPAPCSLCQRNSRVRARVDDGLAVADLDDLGREPLDEIPIVRHEDQRAAVVDERVEQHFLRVEIEMVGRLVEQQRVRRTQQHPRDGQPRALAARQHAHALVDVVSGKQEAAEDVADGRHHVQRRARGQRLVDRRRRDPSASPRPARSTA